MADTTKWDVKDHKIISSLDLDGRIKNSEIAKRILLSKKGVEYRIYRLEEKVISKVYPLFNFNRIGYSIMGVYISLQYLNNEIKERLEEFIKSEELVHRADWARKDYDLVIYIFSNSTEKIELFINGLKDNFDLNIKNIRITYPLTETIYPLDWSKKSRKVTLNLNKIYSKEKISDLDRRILEELNLNSRKSSSEIARMVKSNYKTVNQRIKNLINSGFLIGFKPSINFSELGYNRYRLLLHLSNQEEISLEKILNLLREKSILTLVIKEIGLGDITCEFLMKSNSEFYELIDELQDTFKEVIKDYQFLYMSENIKINFFPVE